MPLYGAGKDEEADSVQQFLGGTVALEPVDTPAGVVSLWAETEDGSAPTLTKADCLLVGAALTALGQP